MGFCVELPQLTPGSDVFHASHPALQPALGFCGRGLYLSTGALKPFCFQTHLRQADAAAGFGFGDKVL